MTSEEAKKFVVEFNSGQLRLANMANAIVQMDPNATEENKSWYERNVTEKWNRFYNTLKI